MIGKLLDHRYQVIRILATGGFGETYIAQDTKRPGKPICVVKHLKPASSSPIIFETAKRLFEGEAETLERLGSHDQIPRLLAYFDENQEFFLVQEYIDGHTLSEELIPGQPWTQSQVIYLLQEVLSILEFVHQQGVIHRDIKPDNIIRRASDYKLVLVDFGAVKQLRTSLVTVSASLVTGTVAIGTPGYMPIEQGQGKPRPNSDIYSLGIIAIQALTGVATSELPEDPDTGEIKWQHLAPVDPQLAAVLTKMVRYHFKDRYQSATEVMQVCKEMGSNHTPSTPVELTTSALERQTIAFAPANPYATKPARNNSSRPDPLPLLIGIIVAGSAAVLVANVYPKAKNFAAKLIGEDINSTNSCLAEIAANSNVRSEPNPINSDNIVQTVGDETKLPVTGKQTKGGWMEVKLNSGRLAWVHSQVVTNHEQLISCLRDQGIAIQTVDDGSLITTRTLPQLQSKPSADKILAQAKLKYESGDLPGAIAIVKSIPANAASGIKDTREIIHEWQRDWAKAEAFSHEINTAINQGKWDKVLSYRNHPEKLPNIKYWRDKLSPLFQEANNTNSQSKNHGKK
jgi:serine/threonine-protein kinase